MILTDKRRGGLLDPVLPPVRLACEDPGDLGFRAVPAVGALSLAGQLALQTPFNLMVTAEGALLTLTVMPRKNPKATSDDTIPYGKHAGSYAMRSL